MESTPNSFDFGEVTPVPKFQDFQENIAANSQIKFDLVVLLILFEWAKNVIVLLYMIKIPTVYDYERKVTINQIKIKR